MADADLFDNWFSIADQDHDGVLTGAEAVHFFQRSNLSQETLFQVWQIVAGDSSSLTKQQFYSTLRLVSLAQRSGGTLPEAQARSLLVGIGPAVPPPTMAGLAVPRQTVTQQTWQSAPQIPGARPAVPAADSATAAFPPMPAVDAQRYRDTFMRLDTNQDGYVEGGDCAGFFLQWGLPKEVLRDIWEVVAGDEGRLSQSHFLGCLYFMDLAKRGVPPPRVLPPGPFPPIASSSAPSDTGSSFSLSSMQQEDVFSREPSLPQIPSKVHYSAPSVPAYASRVPQMDVSSLNSVERSRVQVDQKQAEDLDRQLYQAQVEGQTAKQKEALYKAALQDLTLFKSRTSAALLQAQERADKEMADANAMQARYEAAWAGAEATHAQGRELLDSLTKARARKAEATTKLEQLQRDIAELSSLSPDLVEEENEAARNLNQQIRTAEAAAVKLEMQAAAARAEKAALELKLEEVQLSCAAGQADVAALKRDLAALNAKLKAEDSEAAADLQSLLSSTADVYRTLLAHAKKAGIPVPGNALLEGTPRDGHEPLQWNDFAAVDAEDWEDFEDEGFQVVGVLPEHQPSAAAETEPLQEEEAVPRESATATTPAAPDTRATSHTLESGKSAGFAVDFGDTASSGRGGSATEFPAFSSFPAPISEAKATQESWAAF
ncbi:g10482 [Coccomyxa elongata]